MKIRTIIVDDEAPSRRRMKKLIVQDNQFEVVAEAENGEKAIEIINKEKPDLILLDIELKDMTGFDVLKNISAVFNVKIIFITAYNEFAIKAFEANALDYLLKPYKNDRFFKAISRATEAIKMKQQPSLKELLAKISPFSYDDKFKVKEGKIIHHFDLSDIIYIKSESYYCNFFMQSSKRKIVRISLIELETTLPEYFIRINRSIILNTKKINSVKNLKKIFDIEMITKEQFTAYKNYKNLKEKIEFLI